MPTGHVSLFEPPRPVVDTVKPWKPHALTHEQWPPNYKAVYAWRMETLAQLRANPEMFKSAEAYYSSRPGEFIMHWMDTYNPRIVGSSKWIPFIFFKRQDDFIAFVEELRRDSEGGLVEKCRDIGATWLACAYSVWAWRFLKDDATGWGSRKQELVHKIGDPDSIFEKMFLLLRRMPSIWLPKGFNPRDHATFMKLVNPVNGSTVTGEAGDNIGRGGRKSRYWKDESAHYERAEKIEAALGDNTNVQIDISSVNGLGNVFHRRREAGIVWTRDSEPIERGHTRVFIFDWRHHPEKDQVWYDTRRAKFEREGMLHIFAQEVDRDYSAAVANTVIPLEYVNACVDAHLIIPQLRQPPPDVWAASLDVADEGLDRNAYAERQWIILRDVVEWGARDPGVTAREAVSRARMRQPIEVQYDCIGVGASVKAEYNRLVDDKTIDPAKLRFTKWNAGAAVVSPYAHIIEDDEESPTNKAFFHNFKAQAWWSLRTRCYKTFKCVEAIKAGRPVPDYPADELFSIDGSIKLLEQLKKELAQPTTTKAKDLRLMIDKTPEGTKSPNLADAAVMVMFPSPDSGGRAVSTGYSV